MPTASFLDSVTSPGWIAAIVLFFVAIFRDVMKNAINAALSAIGRFAYRRLAGNRLLRRRALRKYREGIIAATEKIPVPFRPNRPLALSDIYVSLGVSEGRGRPSQDVWALLAEHPRMVVTGPPGAGKSMLLRHLASSGVEAARLSGERNRLPVLLELHRLVRGAESGNSIEDHLVDAFDRYGFPGARKFLRVALEKGWLVLLLDGLDEIPTGERGEVAARLSGFLEKERLCPAIVTCRSAVYRGELDGVADRRMELQPLDDQQIQTFLESWNEPMPAGKSPGQLMAALREQPKLLEAARNPLLLTIITHLYTDRPTYALPRSRADFYRQAADILLDQWQGHLGQNKFEAAEKKTILNALALRMQETTRDPGSDRRTIGREEVLSCAREAMPGLGLDGDQVVDIVREIVERSGLLLQVDGGSRYAFAHLTFQEYFASEALHNRSKELQRRFSDDSDAWREVIVLWCGLAADSTEMVEQVRTADPRTALACVAEARSVDQGLANQILQPVLEKVATGEADEELQRGLGSVAADVRPRGEKILKELIAVLGNATTQEARISIGAALAASNRLPAAEAIVDTLREEPALADSVVRLGNLSVPSLRGASAQERGAAAAIANGCLARIGTPDAAVVLAEMMLDVGSSHVSAAWAFSHVVGNPGVAERFKHFRNDSLERLKRSVTSLTWIWQPFAKGDDAGMVWLVGRAAALIKETKDMEMAVADPDPRICTALCTLDSKPLEVRLEDEPEMDELLDLANECSFAPRYSRAGAGRILASDVDLAHRSTAIDVRGAFGRRSMELSMFDEFVGAVLEDAPMAPVLLSEGVTFGDTTTFVEAVLDRVELRHQLWVRLVRALPPGLRLQVLRRMYPNAAGSYSGQIDAGKWPAAATKVRFRFERSLMYAGTLGLIAALSVIALIGGAWMLLGAKSLLSSQGLIAIAAIFSILSSWIWMWWESDPSSAVGNVDTDVLFIAIFGLIAMPVILVDELRGRVDWVEVTAMLPTAGFLLSLIFLSVAWLSQTLPLIGSLLLVGMVLLTAAALAALGSSREAAQRTPLAGLFAQDRPLGAADGELFASPSGPSEAAGVA